MERKRRQFALLALLAAVLAAVVYVQRPRPAATRLAPREPPAALPVPGRMPTAAPEVRLESLEAAQPVPAGTDRNLFRFRVKEAPPRLDRALPVPAIGTSAGPPPPPPVPPIPLIFLGVLENERESQTIAVLSDGRGVYHGSEGDIIEGRYRILRIGVESIDLAYLDGQGRQTIRKSGS